MLGCEVNRATLYQRLRPPSSQSQLFLLPLIDLYLMLRGSLVAYQPLDLAGCSLLAMFPSRIDSAELHWV